MEMFPGENRWPHEINTGIHESSTRRTKEIRCNNRAREW